MTVPRQSGKRRASYAVVLVSGLVFAIGLGISGMGRPSKVLAFLDVTGDWDPSLAFVMAGAIAVHIGFALRAKRAAAPVLAPSFAFPKKDVLDGSLVLGAAVFGIGWGLAGYCPGPAVVASASGNATPVAFLAAMIVGLVLQRALARRGSAGRTSPSDDEGAAAPPDLPSAA